MAIDNLKETFYDMNRCPIDYEAMKSSRNTGLTKSFPGQIHIFDLKSLIPRQEKLAFWINLYNTEYDAGIR